jgi:hypothetical protein
MLRQPFNNRGPFQSFKSFNPYAPFKTFNSESDTLGLENTIFWNENGETNAIIVEDYSAKGSPSLPPIIRNRSDLKTRS